MPNIFQRIGGLFRREQPQPQEEPARQPPVEEREERRGWFQRVRDRVTGEDRRREERERELQRQQDIEARERQLVERQREIEGRERQLEELRQRLLDQERQRTTTREERQPSRPSVREEAGGTREEAGEPGLPDAMRGVPAIMPLGPKGRDGAAYTTISGKVVMQRIREAAALDKRVSLRVLDRNGWHDLFLNPNSPGRHKAARGMSATYMQDQIMNYGGDFDEWVEEGCDCDGDAGYEDAWEDIQGYQLTVWS